MSSEAIAAIVAAVITRLFAARWAERKQKTRENGRALRGHFFVVFHLSTGLPYIDQF
jgi:membrane protein implicated in regulation of membrane protease activity